MARPVSEMHTSTICCHQLRRRSEDLRARRMKGRTVIIGAEERRRGKNEEKTAEAERERMVKKRICRLSWRLNIFWMLRALQSYHTRQHVQLILTSIWVDGRYPKNLTCREVRYCKRALISYCIDDDDTVGAWRSLVCLRITYTQCSIISPQMLQLRIFRVSRQFANTRQKNAANPVTGAFASYLLCICTIDWETTVWFARSCTSLLW